MTLSTVAVLLPCLLLLGVGCSTSAFVPTTTQQLRKVPTATFLTVPSTLDVTRRRTTTTRRQHGWVSVGLANTKDSILDEEDTDEAMPSDEAKPQVFASGYSTQANLVDALREAVEMAVQGLPALGDGESKDSVRIDLAMVSVSSLYDGGVPQPATTVIPTVLEAAQELYAPIEHLVGSSVAGCISSSSNVLVPDASSTTTSSQGPVSATATKTVELEGIPSVSVTFALLPDVSLRTFDCLKDDLPGDVGRLPAKEWKRPLGLEGFAEGTPANENEKPSRPVFMLLPSPAFSADVDDLLFGLSFYFPGRYVLFYLLRLCAYDWQVSFVTHSLDFLASIVKSLVVSRRL